MNLEKLLSSIAWFAKWQFSWVLLAIVISFFNSQIAIVALSFIFTASLLAVNSFNRGWKNYYSDALSLPLQRMLWLAFIITSVYFVGEINFWHVYSSALAATLITLSIIILLNFSQTFHFIRSSTQENWILPSSTMLKFFWIELAIVAYTRVDMPLLKYFEIPVKQTADYFFSIQLLEAGILMLAPISYFFFNQLAGSLNGHNQKFQLTLLVKYIGLMLGVVSLGIILWKIIGTNLLELFFPQYVSATDKVTLLLLVLFPVSVNYILSSYLILLNKEKSYVLVCFFALFMYLLISVIFIPQAEVYGVISARFVAEISITLMLALLTWQTKGAR
ncbi:hypothetical protein [Litorilituus lipolyticus]|uniref:Polysaccharide biosynthesis protein C-terminal domain-containing protein n=1 Tax=Litorilituus lipolyticus TaxID=2491017 RepID=A0A502L4Z2_9GAMM|nr:hypothetical protein [Litorilituus lipolyticus]TPH17063.1 hypothetical protein EPA86_05105 [Litorilituus lipolyticus]